MTTRAVEWSHICVRMVVLALVASAAWSGACTAARPPLERAVDDSNWMAQWQPGLGGGGIHRGLPITRRGKVRPSLVLTAPARIALQVKGVAGGLRVQGWAAPVFNIGDGCLLSVAWLGGGPAIAAYSRHFDAARNEADREWTPLAFMVDTGGQPDGELIFELTGGPEGDLTADWLALAELAVVPAGEAR